MKYLPAAALAFAVGAGVVAALYFTRNINSLFGLWALYFVSWVMPSK